MKWIDIIRSGQGGRLDVGPFLRQCQGDRRNPICNSEFSRLAKSAHFSPATRYRMKTTGARRGLSVLGLVFTLAVAGSSCESGAGPEDSELDRIEISPSPLVQRQFGGTAQFTATAFDRAGNAMVAQPSFSWASSNRIASIAPTG